MRCIVHTPLDTVLLYRPLSAVQPCGVPRQKNTRRLHLCIYIYIYNTRILVPRVSVCIIFIFSIPLTSTFPPEFCNIYYLHPNNICRAYRTTRCTSRAFRRPPSHTIPAPGSYVQRTCTMIYYCHMIHTYVVVACVCRLLAEYCVSELLVAVNNRGL